GVITRKRSIVERKCQAIENKGKRQLGSPVFPPPATIKGTLSDLTVRYLGHRGLIPLTRSWVPGAQPGVAVDACYVQLGISQYLVNATPSSKPSSRFGGKQIPLTVVTFVAKASFARARKQNHQARSM